MADEYPEPAPPEPEPPQAQGRRDFLGRAVENGRDFLGRTVGDRDVLGRGLVT